MLNTDAAFEYFGLRFFVPAQAVSRHRIEHFVADQAAGKSLRQFVQPLDAAGKLWRTFAQRCLLARAQFAGQLKYPVMLGGAAQRVQCQQQVRRQSPAAGAGFHHQRARGGENLRHLPRQRLAVERRQFGRGKKVAARLMTAKLVRTTRVVAEAGCVERQFHVAGE